MSIKSVYKLFDVYERNHILWQKNIWQKNKKFVGIRTRMHCLEGKPRKIPTARVHPFGPPSKYYLGPAMLNIRDQMRMGVFIVVWS